MDRISTNSTIIRSVTTIPDIFEVKGSEMWVFGDSPDLKGKCDESLTHCAFWKGNYSYSLIIAERNKEMVPLAVFHQDNVDPRLLVTSWLDSNRRSYFDFSTEPGCPSCSLCSLDRINRYVYAYQSTTGLVPINDQWKEDHDVEGRTDREVEKVVTADFNGLYCFIKCSKFLFAKDSELKLSQKGLYKVELDNETIGVAVDPTDVFGNSELSSVFFADSIRPFYALALHKTIGAPRAWGKSIPIESVLYGNVNRSFYNDGNHIENLYYCSDATMGDFSILPDTVFVKVLLHMPWRQRFLTRRVNKRWMKLCNVAISIDTKTIRQDDKQFQLMNTDDLWHLLPIVCGGLEEIQWMNLCASQRPLEILQQIPSFPNLRNIDIGMDNYDGYGTPDYVTLFSLLDKCPNLRELRTGIPTASSTGYSPGAYQVEKLTVFWASKESSLMEIINHFPRLFYLRCDSSITAKDLSAVFEKYGENLAHLQICCMRESELNAGIPGMEKCRNLEYLEFRYADFLSDAFMKDMANGCQKLRTLVITDANKVTNDGLTALASLPNLVQLTISRHRVSADLSLGISNIAKQGRLEQLITVRAGLSPTCLKACVRYCRQLKLLGVARARPVMENDDISLEEAKEIIQIFNGWSLSPRLVFRTDHQVWIHAEIKQLQEEQKESGQHLFVVHFAYSYDDHNIIQDDESINGL